MASEDPGVGTLAVILELLQRTGNVITGTIKSGISFSLDVIKTGMFFAWRRQMMQSQRGPDLAHGKQSLKKLRLHEQVGAEIVSVSIGDKEAMKALDKELKRLKIDYSITDDGGKDKVYTLHYKKSNERDVMLAQANALLRLYGDPSKETPDVDEASRDDSKQDQNQDQNQQQEQGQREQQEQARQEQQQSQEEQARQNQQQDEQAQDQQNQQQQQDEQLREQQQEAVPAPGQDKDEERTDRADSTGTEKAERTANQPLTVAGAAKAVPVDELQQKLSEFASRSQALTPEQSREAVPSRNVSVDELKKYAMERAQRKNLSRQQVRKQSRERSLGKSMTRSRHRGLELGH